MAPHPWHAFAPDAELHAFAFVMPGNDHTSVVPEDWNGWLPPHPEQMSGEPPTPRAKSRKEARKHKRPAPKISEEVARRMQSQLQSATRGVSLRKIFGKYDADRSGTLTSVELKKLIRKELRISLAVVSDADVENLAAALDGDHTGNISVDELLSFIERGSATFFSSPKEPSLPDDDSKEERPKSRDSSHDDDDTDGSEKKAPTTARRSSKTILASTKEPYNRFIYRPLTPPCGGSLITLAPMKTPRDRQANARAKDKEAGAKVEAKAEPKGGPLWQPGKGGASSAQKAPRRRALPLAGNMVTKAP
ncbi:unnamed protein product [Effrenium voratum]|nr:unnamed protein product [Effrenium voratum]